MMTTSKAVVLALVGLPATGKSWLARAVVEGAAARGLRAAWIELDEIARQKSSHQQEWDRSAWRASRAEAKVRVEAELSSQQQQRSEPLSPPLVVVVDDNSQLRSMRLSFARIAAEHCAAFAEVSVGPLPAATAAAAMDAAAIAAVQARNAERTHRFVPVPSAVIGAMAAALEPPDPARFAWEQHCIALPAMWDGGSERVEEVWALIRTALGSGPLRVFDDAAAAAERLRSVQEESRAANRRSAVHQCDAWSRLVVSRAVASTATPDDRSRVASAASALRKRFLAQVSSAAATDQDELKEQFIAELFGAL